jgi:hypothetical protein
VGRHEAARRTVGHPGVGAMTLDCDPFSVAGSDLRIMICTAEPGAQDAARFALLGALVPLGTTRADSGPRRPWQPVSPADSGD